MWWAANRSTIRGQSALVGLLDVSMLMLYYYGEGMKAFHGLQLEVFHMSIVG